MHDAVAGELPHHKKITPNLNPLAVRSLSGEDLPCPSVPLAEKPDGYFISGLHGPVQDKEGALVSADDF